MSGHAALMLKLRRYDDDENSEWPLAFFAAVLQSRGRRRLIWTTQRQFDDVQPIKELKQR
jgi:hypothetical protein